MLIQDVCRIRLLLVRRYLSLEYIPWLAKCWKIWFQPLPYSLFSNFSFLNIMCIVTHIHHCPIISFPGPSTLFLHFLIYSMNVLEVPDFKFIVILSLLNFQSEREFRISRQNYTVNRSSICWIGPNLKDQSDHLLTHPISSATFHSPGPA